MASSIHLDTNYLIAYAGDASVDVVANVEQWILEDRKFCCSAMAWAEFLCGPVLPEEITAMESLLHGVLPVTPELAAEGARLFRETGRRPRSLPD
jgi:predicted nucleic acid-binding protein